MNDTDVKKSIMRNIAMIIEYDGSQFKGWQSQPEVETVQDRVEAALESVLCKPVRITASGRTDVGVHAKGQVANFFTDNPISCYKLPLAVNIPLSPYIAVKGCVEVPMHFNARRSAKRKTYCYRIYCSPTPSPLRAKTHFQVYKQLDVELMQKGADFIVGRHDFTAFMAMGSNNLTTEREVYSCNVRGIDDTVEIEVSGNGFLYNMVRIIAGTLVEVGAGRMAPEKVGEIIRNKDRTMAGKTLRPHGLTLERVEYDIPELDNFIENSRKPTLLK